MSRFERTQVESAIAYFERIIASRHKEMAFATIALQALKEKQEKYKDQKDGEQDDDQDRVKRLMDTWRRDTI